MQDARHANTYAPSHTHTHTHAHTHMRARKTCFREPSVLRENAMITGIRNLNWWPILDVRYLDCKSIKLKKSNGVFKSTISTSNLKSVHSDNVFYMIHVPFANCVVSSHFLRDRKLQKMLLKCVFVNPKGCKWKLHLFTSICLFSFFKICRNLKCFFWSNVK